MVTTCLDEETSKKVIRQVEFYFSDSNVPRDKFLRNTISESEDGMVSLALICSFSRMRGHLGLGDVKADGVPEDTVKAVAETLKTSDFLKISEDGTKVGRKTELKKPEEVIEQLDSRTIAASPLPYDVKLEDVESFFAQLGKVNSVRLPRVVSHKQVFCGTALVEFSAEEDAEKVLKQMLEYAGASLELKPKKDFDAEREKEEKEYEKSGHERENSNDSEEASYPKGLIVAFTLKSKSLGDESKQNGSDEHTGEAEVSKVNGSESVGNGSEVEVKASEEEVKVSKNDENGVENIEETNEKETLGEESKAPEGDEKSSDNNDGEKAAPEGKFAVENDENGGVGNVEETNENKTPDEERKVSKGDEKSSAEIKDGAKAAPEGKNAFDTYKDNMDVVIREDLKTVFQKFGTVRYIDFKIGETSGYIRFDEPQAAQKARAAAVLCEEGGLVVKNFIATLEPVSGDAEKQYWSQVQGNQEKFRNWGHRGGRGGKFNKRGGKHGRHHNRDSSAGRPNKFQKVAT